MSIIIFSIVIIFFNTVHTEEETVNEETSFHPEMSHQVFGDGYVNRLYVSYVLCLMS